MMTISLDAQNFSRSYDIPGSVTEIMIDSKYGNLTIVSAPVNSITIEGDVEINLGTSNESYMVSGKQEGNSFVIKTMLDEDDLEQAMFVKYANGTKKIFHKGSYPDIDDDDEDRNWVSYGFDIEVKLLVTIPLNKKLKVKSIYGSISAEDIKEDVNIHCTYGGADLIQHSFSPSQRIVVESTYSHVDVTVPESIKADLSLKTSYGRIYSNHDIQPSYGKENDHTPFGENVRTKLNGGGITLDLESGYSNIYFRKT